MKTQIIFEDNEILVCFKPAGLAVQSGRASEADMVSELKNYLAKSVRSVTDASKADSNARVAGRPAKKRPVYLGVIHRLDQPVSGLLVFAKTQRAAADLSRQVAQHVVCKIYRAIVMADGELLQNEKNSLKDFMIKEPGGGARIVSGQDKDAKEGRLTWKCLEQKENRALVEVELETGRHHQIRLQMSNAGMPLLGDNRYGSEESLTLSKKLGIRMVQLQAVKLEFTHPTTKKKVCYELEKKLELA